MLFLPYNVPYPVYERILYMPRSATSIRTAHSLLLLCTARLILLHLLLVLLLMLLLLHLLLCAMCTRLEQYVCVPT